MHVHPVLRLRAHMTMLEHVQKQFTVA